MLSLAVSGRRLFGAPRPAAAPRILEGEIVSPGAADISPVHSETVARAPIAPVPKLASIPVIRAGASPRAAFAAYQANAVPGPVRRRLDLTA